MTDKPILFSAPMVKAILEGRKTMTRRVLKPQPAGEVYWNSLLAEWRWMDADGYDDEVNDPVVIPYAPGDLLWVREAHAIVGNVDPGFVLYRANGYEAECERHGFDKPFPPEADVSWRPSIHMPRWASRITLRVTAVKVERLQEISEDDAKAEGVEKPILAHWSALPFKSAFRGIWLDLHGPGAWDANPFVAAYSFERVKP